MNVIYKDLGYEKEGNRQCHDTFRVRCNVLKIRLDRLDKVQLLTSPFSSSPAYWIVFLVKSVNQLVEPTDLADWIVL